MIFEHHTHPLLSRPQFACRMLKGLGIVLIITGFSLMIGILGYRITEHMPWIDALLNASMILGGMGPVGELKTNAGKLFASFYALYSGLFLIAMTGILLAPVIHRVMHGLQLMEKKEK